MSRTTVLLTGAAGFWGERVAARLLATGDHRVIGIDTRAPATPVEGLDFVAAATEDPRLAEFLALEGVEIVCHLAFIETVTPRESAFRENVMGTMNLLGACVEAGVRQVVVKSSTAVYGAHPDNPAFLTEAHPLRGSRAYGYTRDLLEIESLCQGTRRQGTGMAWTVLRFANIVGPTVQSPMVRFLSDPRAPVLMGFDPMMQVIHEDDVVGALVHAVTTETAGIFNVAAEPPMPLWRIMALAGKVPLPVLHPIAYTAVSVAGPRYAPIELDALRYPWVADLSRMREEFGFAPEQSAVEAVASVAARQRLRRFAAAAEAQGARLRAGLDEVLAARGRRRNASDESEEEGRDE